MSRQVFTADTSKLWLKAMLTSGHFRLGIRTELIKGMMKRMARSENQDPAKCPPEQILKIQTSTVFLLARNNPQKPPHKKQRQQ
jgi:hypothetical protein